MSVLSALKNSLTSNKDLLAALQAEGFKSSLHVSSGSWRCGNCEQMISGTQPNVWIPEGALPNDPLWAVKEMLQMGEDVGWCVKCASRFLNQ